MCSEQPVTAEALVLGGTASSFQSVVIDPVTSLSWASATDATID
jgi:hypothetical protein